MSGDGSEGAGKITSPDVANVLLRPPRPKAEEPKAA